MKKEKFSLKIKDINSGGYKNIYYIDPLILTDYEKIQAEIIKINQSNNNNEKNFAIILEYPKKNSLSTEILTIKTKEEWNFLYNYNIISECINKNKLKINIKKISELTEKDNLDNIIKIIMEEKITKTFYFNSLINFINQNNYLEEFKLFFINELFKSYLDKGKDKDKNNNYSILIDKEIKTIENKVMPAFVNTFNKKYLNSLKLIDSLDNIKAIIDGKNEKKEEIEKNEMNTINNTMAIKSYSDDDKNNSDIDENQNNKTTLNYKKENNLLLLETKIDEKKYFDNNNYFKKFKKKRILYRN